MIRRVLSGVRPTGHLHIGNYLGALKNWVRMQQDFDEVLYCIADLHALTEQPDPSDLQQSIRETVAAYIAAGIDTSKCAIFAQSAVPAHTELCWILLCQTPLGWLYRMTQFKEKTARNKDNTLSALFCYPVLMAADILVYKATHVPVGEDQKQHIELVRDIASAFNRRYGRDFFPIPKPVLPAMGARIMSLRDGSRKMSKTDESDYSRINLTDNPDRIILKIRKAKSDSELLPATTDGLEARPEALNLVTIYATLSNVSPETALKEVAGQSFSSFKEKLAEVAVDRLAPIAKRIRELMSDPGELDRILAQGARRAGMLAESNIAEVRRLTGLQIDAPMSPEKRIFS